MTELGLAPPRKVTLVEGVIEQIVREIQAGRLKPGDRLPSERQLIETLQVGRSSVREALQGLAVMGFVEIRPGHGTFVSNSLPFVSPNVTDANAPASIQREMRLKLVEARRIVECETARLAAVHGGTDASRQLSNAFKAMQQGPYVSQQDRSSPHHQFHLEIARLAQNPFLAAAVDKLLRAVPTSLRQSEFLGIADLRPLEIYDAELKLHHDILAAIEAADPEAATRAMHAHMDFEVDLIHRVFRE